MIEIGRWAGYVLDDQRCCWAGCLPMHFGDKLRALVDCFRVRVGVKLINLLPEARKTHKTDSSTTSSQSSSDR